MSQYLGIREFAAKSSELDIFHSVDPKSLAERECQAFLKKSMELEFTMRRLEMDLRRCYSFRELLVSNRWIYIYLHFDRLINSYLQILTSSGCTRSDFPDQIDGGLDQKLFTIIAIDLPGYGKSRPPERMYSRESYFNDARKAAGLMEKLGCRLYSVLGWSDGAKIALLLAIQQQARVDKLVVWGVVPYASEYDIKAVAMTRDTSIFDPKSRQLYIKAYGQELFEQLWHKHVDYCVTFSDYKEPVWDVRKEMRTIKCPTLILHGDKDPLIDKNHPYTAEREIADSRLVHFPNGSHNIHQVFVQEFNKAVTDFLLE